jgi:hypothetical protein
MRVWCVVHGALIRSRGFEDEFRACLAFVLAEGLEFRVWGFQNVDIGLSDVRIQGLGFRV